MSDSTASLPVLEVKGLTMDFGGLRAVDHVDLDIYNGEIVALIGPNGAGKTTFFNCITGIYKPTEGDIIVHSKFGEKRVNGLKPNHVTELGLARTFQNIRLFPNMSVLENVMIGRHCRTKAKVMGALLRDKRTRVEETQAAAVSFNILEKVGLSHLENELASNLSYGNQRKLEIARALATEPVLLLLDEPAAGMNPYETEELTELIKKIATEMKISILLIEHDMKLVMKISERIYVMDHGQRIAAGSPNEIKEDPTVIKAYLGEEVDA
ncbi:ABC transporter ATP-binding protein [Limisalsivibrio acetivorans]|uniref:ABC transporter ATP-binding protein n=1 Tax=Limisalsivibrio acetivorans TaxID=1304888 RepID=UPI0003B7A07C|nr:ABC transporter ATP-binding protein [Limisalsivibrio acetivorans]